MSKKTTNSDKFEQKMYFSFTESKHLKSCDTTNVERKLIDFAFWVYKF